MIALIERNADDATSSSGCHRCDAGRDRFTGWGELDIAAAVTCGAANDVPSGGRNASVAHGV